MAKCLTVVYQGPNTHTHTRTHTQCTQQAYLTSLGYWHLELRKSHEKWKSTQNYFGVLNNFKENQ